MNLETASSDVGVGTIALAGGTLATMAGGATDYGSWRFDEAGDKLVVTQDSAVSALNVKFGSPTAHINVAAGRTLNFTGTIRDASSGGISYLTVSNGTGTVTLAGVNTYSGATLIASGTLIVTNVGATVLAAGDSFQLFAAGAYNNAFAALILPPLESGLMWVNRLAVDGTIVVQPSVSTVPSNLGWSGRGGSLTLLWPENQIGWRLLEQTNNLAAGVSSDPNDGGVVAGSSTTNQVNLPLDVAKPAGFYRLTYP